MCTSLKRRFTLAGLLVVFFGAVQNGNAQMSGSRAGVFGQATQGQSELATLTPEAAQSFITIEGKSVLSVKPTSIRIVLAITSEAMSSRDCKADVEQKIAQLRPLWNRVGVANENIVEDFISILPRYEFEVTELDGQDVAMEKKEGYLMQTNLHVAVKDDAEAMKVLDVAFANDVTSIIGFDYWSEDLDRRKQEVRAKAIQAAKEKAKVMLDGLFEKTPPVINVQESTVVNYPDSMYQSFENASSDEYQASYASRRNLPLIKLARPKNTYYRGNLTNADTQAGHLPMRAELSVVSTVRIYYESPAAKSFNASREK